LEREIQSIDIMKIFRMLIDKLLWIICAVVVGVSSGVIYTIETIPDKYISSATIIVNANTNDNVNTTSGEISFATQLVSIYSVILKSDTLLDEVVKKLNLNSVPGYEYITGEGLANYVSVSQVNNTYIIKLSVTTNNSELSTDILTEIVRLAPAAIIKIVNAGSVEVISAPKAYGMYTYDLQSNMIKFGAVAAVLMAGIIILIGLLDNRIKTEEDITEELNLTVIGIIPHVGE